MITENGIVTQATPATAWVKTTRSSACEHCTSKESCGESLHGFKEMTVVVENTLGVMAGDPVVIGMETKPMLILSFFLYVFPILLLVFGALIGDNVAGAFGISRSLSAMTVGFGFFAAAFLVLRNQQKHLSQKQEFKPFLVRKSARTKAKHCSS